MTPPRIIGNATLHLGDCLDVLRCLPGNSVNCCVTSPPYFGLRDYGHDGQIGLEPTPDEYVAKLVEVFREVRRVLKKDGTLWMNLGDSYNSPPVGRFNGGGFKDTSAKTGGRDLSGVETSGRLNKLAASGLPPKNLLGIPWRVAFALQADGWYLRQDIIWHKPNPMPESVTDRCTKAHEYLFLLSKEERYWYNADAIKESATGLAPGNTQPTKSAKIGDDKHRTAANLHKIQAADTRNRRSVWTIPTQPYPGAHFATYPPELIKPCILAGCPHEGTVLDPFNGSGTTGAVALSLGRHYIGIELNPDYLALAVDRIQPIANQPDLFHTPAPVAPAAPQPAQDTLF